MWKYSVTLKSFSSQPDIPWGVIKHQLPLDDTYDTNLLYRDGYYMAPYILGLLNYEDKRQQDNAAMVAANGDGDDD
jgi:hypothetical protein